MKSYLYILTLFVVVMGRSVWGQEQSLSPSNPSVSGLMQYESNPASLSTGVPNISIPLYKMPTLSKDISIGIGLSYHPSTVVAYDSLAGNCGRGWTMSNGGVISREMDMRLAEDSIANQEGLYYFSFMQYSGKFKVENTTLNSWQATINENSGKLLLVKIAANSFTDMIESFAIYDDKGYAYVFSETDQYTYTNYIFDPQFTPGLTPIFSIPQKSAYHLHEIIDPNGVTLAEYHYNTHYPAEDYYPNNASVQQQLSGITINGYGSMEFEETYDPAEKRIRYEEMVVKDYHENVIRKFEFGYDSTHRYLTSVNEGDTSMSNVLSYKLYYKNSIPLPNDFVVDIDNWGYYNTSPITAFDKKLRSLTRNPSGKYGMRNVLEKMELPTGGCVVYEYEPNSYAARDGKSLGLVYNDLTEEYEEDPDYFITPSTANIHNFISTPVDMLDFTSSSSPQTFTPPSTGIYYFTVEGDPTEAEIVAGDPKMYYPQGMISYGGFSGEFGAESNAATGNYGSGFSLTNGINYSVGLWSMATTDPRGKVYVNTLSLVSNPIKQHQGNGIRIKNIGYFARGDVNQHYFEGPSGDVPDRVVSYNYNLEDTPDRSSGSISDLKTIREWDPEHPEVYNTPSKRNDPVWYKNVTVTDSNKPGKVVYEFSSPLESPRDDESFDTYSFGKPNKVTAYNTVGDTIKKTSFTYSKHQIFTVGPRMELTGTGYNQGWSETSSMKDRIYYPGGHTIEERHRYEYGGNRRIATDIKNTSISNDSLVTKYFYHSPSIVTNNRIGCIERIENYRNTELLSTSKINYLADWDAIDDTELLELPNPAWLVASDSISKGDRDGRVRIRYNKYDGYSHPLEVQQENGLKTTFLWGYHHTQIVAKIENMDYDTVPKTLIDAIRDTADSGDVQDLLDAFDNLRADTALAGARITTYTYIPLVGMSKMTDPNGQTTTYEYDILGRLKSVKDHDGHLLSENEYNYRTQN